VISFYQLSPELCQCCAAAGDTTRLGFNHGMTEEVRGRVPPG
jgi:hypothetical protein